jgi:hypothetical protein
MLEREGVPVCAVDLYSQEQPKSKLMLLKIALSVLVYIECGIDTFTHRAIIQPDNQLALNVVLWSEP